MKRVVPCLLLAALAASPAFAGDDLAPLSENAVHFRLEVGIEPGHVVSGWLDAREGETLDCAVLDLDGDGLAEAVQKFPWVKDPRQTKAVLHPKVVLEHEGARWELDLRYSRFAGEGEERQASIRWSVTKGDFYAWFINGKATFHTTEDGAAKAAPVRIGPPFHFQTGFRTRGREALVTVGLKDGNGATMRLARGENRQQRRIRVSLAQGGESRYETWATYG